MSKLFSKLRYGLNRLKSELINEEDYWHVDLTYREKNKFDLTNYHLDFSKKANYPFKIINDIPIVNINNIDVELVITIISYGIGLIETNAEENKKKLISISNWLIENQSTDGYWKNNYDDKQYNLSSGWDSGMTQGLAISFIIRMKNLNYLDEAKADIAIEKALIAMLSDKTTTIFNNKKIIEEYGNTNTCVLNGFLFSIMGLWDYGVYKNDYTLFNQYQSSLRNILDFYKFGFFWSYYDVKGLVASAFYHKLHINMLKWLNSVNPDRLYSKTIKIWKIGLYFKFVYIFVKAFQKLINLSKIDTLDTK
ncbi:MAG: D-glucuronyl C5-epimerase family protein [Bacteroidales bacterium]